MSKWQERITRETAPAIRVEHELRYRLAAPLIAASGAWADLGCGNGLAAAAALRRTKPPHTVLVDLDAQAVALAAGELGVPEATRLTGDLTDPQTLRGVGEALLSGEEPAVVTCFEVLEHLETFLPLLQWAGTLAREHGVTFLLSVPNDAFWSIQNPHHRTMWGEGSFEELRRLLPAPQTLLRQVALSGSAFVGFQGESERHQLSVEIDGAAAAPTHLIAAFGPMHEQLSTLALAVQEDTLGQRRWERERESSLAVAEQTVREQIEQLHANSAEFETWRAYIHELERRLGDLLSGELRTETAASQGTQEHDESGSGAPRS